MDLFESPIHISDTFRQVMEESIQLDGTHKAILKILMVSTLLVDFVKVEV